MDVGTGWLPNAPSWRSKGAARKIAPAMTDVRSKGRSIPGLDAVGFTKATREVFRSGLDDMATNGSVPAKDDLAHNGETRLETKADLEHSVSTATVSDEVSFNQWQMRRKYTDICR